MSWRSVKDPIFLYAYRSRQEVSSGAKKTTCKFSLHFTILQDTGPEHNQSFLFQSHTIMLFTKHIFNLPGINSSNLNPASHLLLTWLQCSGSAWCSGRTAGNRDGLWAGPRLGLHPAFAARRPRWKKFLKDVSWRTFQKLVHILFFSQANYRLQSNSLGKLTELFPSAVETDFKSWRCLRPVGN